MQTVVFKIGKEEYCFDIKNVQEIVRVEQPYKIPNMPEYIEGVINLRGKVIPVLNLAHKFNLEAKEENDETRLIVLNIGESKMLAAKADEVTEVLTIRDDNIEKISKIASDDTDTCLEGIAKMKERLIILLDSNKIMAAEEIGLLEQGL